MSTKAKAAKGTLIQRGDGVTPTEGFTTIGAVRSFSGPTATLATFDATNFDSAAVERGAGLPDSGQVTFECLFIGSNAQQQGLESDRVAGTLRNFKIVLNDHATTKTTYSFAAHVTAVSPGGGGPSEPYTLSITLELSGALTKTYAPA